MNLETTVVMWSGKSYNGLYDKIKIIGVGLPHTTKRAPNGARLEFERGPLTATQMKKVEKFIKKHGFITGDDATRSIVLLDKERATLRYVRYCR